MSKILDSKFYRRVSLCPRDTFCTLPGHFFSRLVCQILSKWSVVTSSHSANASVCFTVYSDVVMCVFCSRSEVVTTGGCYHGKEHTCMSELSRKVRKHGCHVEKSTALKTALHQTRADDIHMYFYEKIIGNMMVNRMYL